MKYEVVLSGCTPVPLAHYLKALGILRLVSEQVDASAEGWWSNGSFYLRSKLAQEKLVEFFRESYRPSAVLVPWSGSDFFGVRQKFSSNQNPPVYRTRPTSSEVIESILATSSDRLSAYRCAIKTVLEAMDESGVLQKKDIEGSGTTQRRNKSRLLQVLRNRLSDEALAWIDAACVIGTDGLIFNTLLGSGGGSDGNSHFSDNFMQALWLSLSDFDDQRATSTRASNGQSFDSHSAVTSSLFGGPSQNSRISDLSPVLFDSTRVGGPNLTSGFTASSSSNPWDFIFMLEGSFTFAGSLVKKLGNIRPSVASFPFLLNASLVGKGALAKSESQGREVWLPLWDTPSSYKEVVQLFANGRIEKHGRAATTGLDAFIAIAQSGTDTGVKRFQRIGFFRGRIGGDNYFTAIDQGTYECHRNERVNLLKDIDVWLERFKLRARADDAPDSATYALQELESRIVDFCRNGESENVTGVLIALGRCEAAMARSPKWRNPAPPTAPLRPVPLLSPAWLDAIGFFRQQRSVSLGELALQDCRELRLAAALASVGGSYGGEWFPLRCHLEPVDAIGQGERISLKWSESSGNDVVWHKGNLVDAMNAVFTRRLIRAEQTDTKNNLPDASRVPVLLGDIAAFIENRIDEQKFVGLLWGLSLIDWCGLRPLPQRRLEDEQENAVMPSSLYALLKLCFQRSFQFDKSEVVPLVPAIHRQAMRGAAWEASMRATRRLRASGSAPAVEEVFAEDEETRRTAAALLFPLTDLWQIKVLRQAVGCAEDDESTNPEPLTLSPSQS